jgi:L-alanine-DL-glutamate epimerase-like enolase superfamily enzyme
MKITGLRAIIVEEPAASDAALDAVIVRVDTDEGISGYGEVNALPIAVDAALRARTYHSWSMSFADILVGEDPEHTDRLWDRMYAHTGMSGRRGLVANIIAGIDVALWDIRGKAAGKPVHHLLGGARRDRIEAYLTIDPAGSAALGKVKADSVAMIARGRELGFNRMKQEAAIAQAADDRGAVGLVRAARDALGADGTLMLDAVFRWQDAKSALAAIRRMEEADLYFVEAPFSHDAIESYARLTAQTPTRIAAGEWSITRFEFHDLIDRGGVDVVQPGVCRVGGFTEALRIARYAADRGRLLVPYGWWATNIGLMASIHLAAVCDICPFVEYVHPELYPSVIRAELTRPATRIADGGFTLPQAPGLGIEIDGALLQRLSRQGA